MHLLFFLNYKVKEKYKKNNAHIILSYAFCISILFLFSFENLKSTPTQETVIKTIDTIVDYVQDKDWQKLIQLSHVVNKKYSQLKIPIEKKDSDKFSCALHGISSFDLPNRNSPCITNFQQLSETIMNKRKIVPMTVDYNQNNQNQFWSNITELNHALLKEYSPPDYLSQLPTEMTEKIIATQIPEKVNDIDEFISIVQYLTSFALTNKNNYQFITSSHYIIKKIMRALPSDTLFFEAMKKIEENRIPVLRYFQTTIAEKIIVALPSDTLFFETVGKIRESKMRIPPSSKINEFREHISALQKIKLLYSDSAPRKVEIEDIEKVAHLIHQGFSPSFTINNKPLLKYIKKLILLCHDHQYLVSYPQLGIDLLNHGVPYSFFTTKSAHAIRLEKVLGLGLSYDKTPLFSDASFGKTNEEYCIYEKFLLLLIEKGLNPNEKFYRDRYYSEIEYPLLIHAINLYKSYKAFGLTFLTLLLEKGANVTSRYCDYNHPSLPNSTPWKEAEKIQKEYPEILELFRKYKT